MKPHRAPTGVFCPDLNSALSHHLKQAKKYFSSGKKKSSNHTIYDGRNWTHAKLVSEGKNGIRN